MKKLLLPAVIAALALLSSQAFAANAQCDAQASEKKLAGAAKTSFMKTCLSAKKVTQQDKMKACNADPKAKASKGDERKAFMKECLSK